MTAIKNLNQVCDVKSDQNQFPSKLTPNIYVDSNCDFTKNDILKLIFSREKAPKKWHIPHPVYNHNLSQTSNEYHVLPIVTFCIVVMGLIVFYIIN